MQKILEKLIDKPIHRFCLKASLMLNIIYPSRDHKIFQKIHLWTYLSFSTVFGLTLYVLYFIYNTTTSSQKIFCGMFIGACSNASFLIMINYSNREKFLKCYQNVLDYTTDRVHQVADALVATKLFYLLVIFTIQSSMIGLYPLVLAAFSDQPLGSELTLVVTQYSFWDPSTSYGYLCTVIVQACNISLPLFALMGQTVFIFTMYLVFEGLHHEFVEKTRRMDDNPTDSVNDSITDEKYLKELILRHRNITMIIQDYAQAIEFMITMTISINIVLGTFTVYITVLTPTNYYQNLKMLAISSLLIMFAVPCYIGEFISHMNGEFQFELYSTNWYKKSIRYRKEFYIFLMFLDRTFTINFFGKYAVNYALFLSVLQKIYLIVQFLLIMKKKGAL
ncbi:odorant receptor 85f [Planococcus citri]|uniref:odorant receptor 85f n=1 Tax=Planococcus citri TaxID=170843 RepID=UPI0031F9F79B